MTNEEIIAYQAMQRKFRETEIGKLYGKHLSTTIAYWQKDADERISDRRLRELDEAAKKATDEFVGRLMADYGII